MLQRIHLTNQSEEDVMIYLQDPNDLLGKIEPNGETIVEIELKPGFLLSVVQYEDGFLITEVPDLH